MQLPRNLKHYSARSEGNATAAILTIGLIASVVLGASYLTMRDASAPRPVSCEQFGRMSGQKVFEYEGQCRVIIGSSGENVSLTEFLDYLGEQRMKREARKPTPEKQTF